MLVIGAGPAGSLAAALLRQQGRQVLVLEREQFPRFSIGESLLPQSMEYLEQAGMLRAVQQAGFQLKNGAAFVRGEQYTEFDFSDKYSSGWSTTYQVAARPLRPSVGARSRASWAPKFAIDTKSLAVDLNGARPRVTVKDPQDHEYFVEAGFILDASGFGRVLPRLLQLETPSNFPVRGSIFTHVEDRIARSEFDRNKIRVTVHPSNHDVWYWLIPFAGGRSSIGVVAERSFLARYEGSETERLQALIGEDPSLSRLLRNTQWDTPARQIVGYAANVKSLCGPGYALLGNAGEFLDPIFSSGVTIAFKSASLAVTALRRQFAGETVDWYDEFAAPLKRGVDTFRAFVESWYRGGFQRIIFRADPPAELRAHDLRNSRRLCLGPDQSLRA